MIVKKIFHTSLCSLAFLCLFMAQAAPAFAKDNSSAAETIRDLNKNIMEATEKGDWPTAILAAEKVLQTAKAEFGDHSLKTADAMNNLANLYMFTDRPREAEKLYQQAILIDLERLNNESPEMADIYYNLGMAYAVQKKYKSALDILNKALSIRLKKLGPDDVATQKTEQMMAELKKRAYPNAEKI